MRERDHAIQRGADGREPGFEAGRRANAINQIEARGGVGQRDRPDRNYAAAEDGEKRCIKIISRRRMMAAEDVVKRHLPLEQPLGDQR